MLFDKDHSIPSTPSNPHTRACGTSMAATNSVSNWEACSRKTLLATGSEILSWGYILLRCCWQHHDRLEMAGCYTASMNHKVLQDFFFSWPVEVADLLWAESMVAKLHVCFFCFLWGSQQIICISRTPLVLLDCILPHPPTCPKSVSPSSPSPLQPINHSSVFLCTLLSYVLLGFSSASLTHATYALCCL